MNTETVNEECGCGSKVSKLLSFLNGRGSVHPIEPFQLDHSEFLQINRQTKIRILHIKPENVDIPIRNTQNEAAERRQSTNRNSLTEEYWFTRWNKPLKAGKCNCSFRRSARYSKLSNQMLSTPSHVENITENSNSIRMSELSNYENPPTQIVNVETFAERLTQETLLEAFQEYYISHNKTINCNGFQNFGFEKSIDDVDGVILRRAEKEPAVLPTECVPMQTTNNNVKKSAKHNCTHTNKSRSENKPMVMLFHGIGNSADIWLNIINSLLSRGFEVAAPDMLGHGYSSAPKKRKAYRFKKLLTQALAVFDYFAQKDDSRKFIIIGHSFGCSLATAISRYRPQQAVQLVLVSGGGPTALSAPVTGNEISLFGCLQVLISPLLFCGIKRSLFYSSRGKHFKPCDNDTSIPKYVLEYIHDEQNWVEGDAAFHRRILIPTLLVHGLKDTQVTLVQECEMERTIPRAFLELIPTAGHMSLLETPEQLSHMILCFVEWWAR